MASASVIYEACAPLQTGRKLTSGDCLSSSANSYFPVSLQDVPEAHGYQPLKRSSLAQEAAQIMSGLLRGNDS